MLDRKELKKNPDLWFFFNLKYSIIRNHRIKNEIITKINILQYLKERRMIRKIQIGSYILALLNIIQLISWISGAYGRNGFITLSNKVFFSLNTFFPFFISLLSLAMIILSRKKVLSVFIMLTCAAQTAFFTVIIIIGMVLFS